MKKILLIDRDQVFLSCLKDLFESKFQVKTAYDGIKGLQLIRSFKPDLVLCAIEVPRLDGYQILTNIRNQVNTAKIPFIFLSGFSEWEQRDRALQLGANEYLKQTRASA
jgi:CheY-like chemotaxis protein